MDILANLFSNVASTGDLSTTAPSTDTGAPARLFSVALDSAELKLAKLTGVDSVRVDGPVDVKIVGTELVDNELFDVELANAKSEPTAVKLFTIPANQKTSDSANSVESAAIIENETQAVERVVIPNASQVNSIFDCHGNIPDCHGYPGETKDEVVPTDTRTNNDEVDVSTASVVPLLENADVVVDDVIPDDTAADAATAEEVPLKDISVEGVSVEDVTVDDFTFDESHALNQSKLDLSPFDQTRIDLPRIHLSEHDALRRVDDNLATENVAGRENAGAKSPVEADTAAIDSQLFDPVADQSGGGSTVAQSTLAASSNVPKPISSIEKQAVTAKLDAIELNTPAVVSGIHHERPPSPRGLDQLTDLLIRSSVTPPATASLNTTELPTISSAIPKPELTDKVQTDHQNTSTNGGVAQDRMQITGTSEPLARTLSESAPARSVPLPLGAPGQSEAIKSGLAVSPGTSEIELTIKRNSRSQIVREDVPVSGAKLVSTPVRQADHPNIVRQPAAPLSVDGANIADVSMSDVSFSDNSLSDDNSLRTAVTATAPRGDSSAHLTPKTTVRERLSTLSVERAEIARTANPSVSEFASQTQSDQPIRRVDPPQSQRPSFPIQRTARPEIVQPVTSAVDPGVSSAEKSPAIDHRTATPHTRSNQNVASVPISEIHPESFHVDHQSHETETLTETEPANEAQSDSFPHENKRSRNGVSDVNVAVPVQRAPARTSRYGNSLSTSDEKLQIDNAKPETTESDHAQVAGEKPNSSQPFDSNVKASTRIVSERFDASPFPNSTAPEALTNHLTADPVTDSTVGNTQRNSASSFESPTAAARPGIPQQLLATIENFIDEDGLSTVAQNETVELRMKLNPVDLGEVVLLLNQSADAKTASILVGDKIVQQLVESGMEQVEATLRELGFDSVEVDVFNRDTRDQRFEHARQERSPMESQEDQRKSSDTRPEEPATSTPDEPTKQQGINIVA